MDEDRFWSVIALFDWKKTGDDDAVLAPAQAALVAREAEAICAFQEILAQKLHALDTRDHCRACYEGELDPDDGDAYISADDFLYHRCAVVANGRDYYDGVLATPATMPRGLWFESILHLASGAFEEKTGEYFEYHESVSYESFQNERGWAPTPATTQGRATSDNVPPGNRRPT
ncbi:MAG: DUF4240 domain-containing protein [Gemmatimonadota bacterium]|nr:DUF4240 domain-containing protein [Gemmatimonadota bacterium]